MAHNSEEQNKLRQYFLGELTFEEQVLVEQRLFLDSEYAEIAQGVEDDLIDDFLHKDLTPTEQLRFEGRFIKKPEREMDLRIAEALGRYLNPKSFVAPHAAQYLERPKHPGALREVGSAGNIPDFVYPESIADDSPEESATTSAEFRKQAMKWWLLLAAAILIVLCIVLWFAVRQ